MRSSPRARGSRRASRVARTSLARQLRLLRAERGLSQERLGALAELSGKFIGEVERGEKSISVDSLYRIATALEIPLAEVTTAIGQRSLHPIALKIIRLVGRHEDVPALRSAYSVLHTLLEGTPPRPRRR